MIGPVSSGGEGGVERDGLEGDWGAFGEDMAVVLLGGLKQGLWNSALTALWKFPTR